MKKIATIALASVLGAGALSAQSLADLTLTGTFNLESEYVFRGQKLAQESFQPSLEAGLPLYGGDFYAGVWTNLPIENNAENEIDFYAGFAYPVTDMFTVDVGAIYYWYPSQDNSPLDGTVDREREVYVGVSADVILSPAVYGFWDFDQEGWTLEGSVGYTFDLEQAAGVSGAALELGGYLGYTDVDDVSAGQGTEAGNGYGYVGGSADLTYQVNEATSTGLGVRVAYNNDDIPGASDTFFWWGANVTFSY